MNIILSGYGRMGKEIEKIALSKGHSIVARIDTVEDWDSVLQKVTSADVVIDFSQPEVAVQNIKRCIDYNIPIVTGTTGWYDAIDEIYEYCGENNGTLFYAPNFSIGVNLFFLINQKMAKLMSSFEEYEASMKEIHHVHKLDAPSGTAIKAAEGLLENHSGYKQWVNRPEFGSGILPIVSERTGEVPGTHVVKYESDADMIELKHEAKNRSGFASGAVLAAEWVFKKQGIFTMEDLLKSIA